MSNNQTFLGLHLGINNTSVVLIFDYKITKFKDLKIEPTPNVVFNPEIDSNIKISFNEVTATDDADMPEGIFTKKIAVPLGPYRQSVDGVPPRTLGEWESNCLDSDHVYRKYQVIVEIDGEDGRKTVTYISEDADIDLTKIHIDYEMVNDNQA